MIVLKLDMQKKLLKKYKPNYIFSPKKYFEEFNKFHNLCSLKNYSLIKTNFKRFDKINTENLLLLSTSGTTQSPKFVRLSNLNLQSNTKSIINYLKIKSHHTTITTMPMGYSYGLSILNTHLASGSKIVVNNATIFEKKFWDKVYKYKISSMGGVPQFYEQLKRLNFEKMNLTNLIYLTQAGGKLEDGLLKYFGSACKKKRIEFFVMYGQTEASPRMSYLKWDKFFSKYGSIGKALKGSKFKILDKKKKYINESKKIGELIYFGKNVSLGYAKVLKDLRNGDINKGKLFTGDLAYKDDENYFYITGRKNRISKVFGLRINLDDVEKHLKKNHYKIKCIPDNKYLKILTTKNYSQINIKKIINDYYGINKNFILISKVKQFAKLNSFKEVAKFN